MFNEPRTAIDSIALHTLESTYTRLYIHIKARHAFQFVVRGIAVLLFSLSCCEGHRGLCNFVLQGELENRY